MALAAGSCSHKRSFVRLRCVKDARVPDTAEALWKHDEYPRSHSARFRGTSSLNIAAERERPRESPHSEGPILAFHYLRTGTAPGRHFAHPLCCRRKCRDVPEDVSDGGRCSEERQIAALEAADRPAGFRCLNLEKFVAASGSDVRADSQPCSLILGRTSVNRLTGSRGQISIRTLRSCSSGSIASSHLGRGNLGVGAERDGGSTRNLGSNHRPLVQCQHRAVPRLLVSGYEFRGILRGILFARLPQILFLRFLGQVCSYDTDQAHACRKERDHGVVIAVAGSQN